MKVWLDGKIVAIADAKVSLFDAGFQHGVGLFSTMCARHGRVFRVMAHLERLKSSAMQLGMVKTLRLEPLAEAIELVLAANRMESARIRLTVTAGDLRMLSAPGVDGPASHSDPTIAIVVQPPTRYPAEIFERGVRVRIAEARLNPMDQFAGHKTIWYWPRLAELQRAAASACSESLFFTVHNRLAAGSVSNVFVVRDGVVKTPFARGEGAVGSDPPVLVGVTRGAIIACAQARGIAVVREDITIDDLLASDEVFLTNSSWGVLPVVGIEQRTIGQGAPGSMTQAFRSDYEELLEDETLLNRVDSVSDAQ
ncbi:MAG: hypothetical protein EXS15_06000 [Phycisphaerales bacterium]|nr:hypothetical protein [Phycisphaerales bacterium]